METGLLDPALRAVPDGVGELLAEDFIEIGSSGGVFDKAAIIAALLAEAAEDPVQRNVSDMDVQLLSPDVALITYRVRRSRSDAASVVNLRSSIWARRDGRWRMRFHQGTRVQEQSGPETV
ncbi:DUF4440 domain-containing protein [Aurantimonas sp. VKM B-3413]|uniref:nuclear transport factor 2 family protein n=1 Tax=Aurantimonas sp. VKM B-3413 TaxID=2779401 RepID=UPI001E3A04BB|nr:DUF4440 domain-containing protein [Aurantimonas sp. VKM B-3413]